MTYKAVIFDLFGTLVKLYVGPGYEAMFDRVAGILNISPQEMRRYWQKSLYDRSIGVIPDNRTAFRAMMDELGKPVTQAQLDQASQVRLDYTARSLTPRADALATLRALRAAGLKTALVSDCTSEIPAVWPDTAFEGLFDVTIFSCAVGVKKPDPRIYQLALDRLGTKPEECLYVGDGSSRELSGARAVGLRAILIRDPHEVVQAIDPDQREDDWDGERIGRLSELLPLLGLA
jgi:putative hydrolase of the HAD superfamily